MEAINELLAAVRDVIQTVNGTDARHRAMDRLIDAFLTLPKPT